MNSEKLELMEEQEETNALEEVEEVEVVEDEDDDDSSLGLVGFLAAIFGLTVFGFVFSIIHLVSKQQKYRKLAIAGVVISACYLVGTIAYFVLYYFTYIVNILTLLIR